jgi:hypothetical protein
MENQRFFYSPIIASEVELALLGLRNLPSKGFPNQLGLLGRRAVEKSITPDLMALICVAATHERRIRLD